MIIESAVPYSEEMDRDENIGTDWQEIEEIEQEIQEVRSNQDASDWQELEEMEQEIQERRSTQAVITSELHAVQMKCCKKIIDELLSRKCRVSHFHNIPLLTTPFQKFAYIFYEPVDFEGMGLWDYPHVVQNPMDLGTIKKKFDNQTYSNPEEFRQDVLLTGHNCLLYNPIGDPYREHGQRLLVGF